MTRPLIPPAVLRDLSQHPGREAGAAAVPPALLTAHRTLPFPHEAAAITARRGRPASRWRPAGSAPPRLKMAAGRAGLSHRPQPGRRLRQHGG